MGWVNAARYKWAELMGNKIKFKPATFYLEIVDHLAKAVEGLKPEDEAAGRSGGGQDELPGSASHGVETKRAPVTSEGLKELPSTNKPSGKGKDENPRLATILGPKHHDKAAAAILDAMASTSARKPPLPLQQPEPNSKDPQQK